MLKERVVTSLVLAFLVLGAIFYLPKLYFCLLALLILLWAYWEYLSLLSCSYIYRIGFLIVPIFIVLPFIYLIVVLESRGLGFENVMMIILPPIITLLLISTLWWLMVPYFLWRYTKNKHIFFMHPITIQIVIFISAWFSLFMIRFFWSDVVLCLLLTMVCATDIGAYFIGGFFGKHPLASEVSPKKTIEGVAGGVLASLLVTIAFILFVHFPKEELILIPSTIFLLLVLSTTVSSWSVIGDLFESMLKRQAGVKNSGKLLPGHGGIYDRIDGFIAAAPIFALGFLLIKNCK